MLRSSRDFRVRAQAALALGREHDVKHAAALESALRDRDPLVRTAAATALGDIASLSSLPALRRATQDGTKSVVRQANVAIELIEIANSSSTPRATQAKQKPSEIRYVLVVGDMHNESKYSGSEVPRVLGASLWRELASLRSVSVLRTENEAAIAAAVRRGLPVLRLEGNVTQLESETEGEELSVHCEVSLIVMDDAGRTMRTVLKGAATGIEPRMGDGAKPVVAQTRRVAHRAVDGAVRSALRNASSAIENAAARADVKGKDTATASLPR
jgi:hypothetical protein